MTKKLTTEEFIKRAVNIHGNKYDYSQTIYINNRTKVKIICKLHGEFTQGTSAHLKTGGCKKCGVTKNSESRKLTHEQFVLKLPKDIEYEIIGKYTTSLCKILVRDRYGEYLLKPTSLINGVNTSLISSINKTQYIINRAIEVHNGNYDYSLVEYDKNTSNIKIICKNHGIFIQDYKTHINGANCKKCVLSNRLKSENIRLHLFVLKAEKIHNSIYDYTNSKFIDKNSVSICCPHHGEFVQKFSTHLTGKGCNKCGRSKITEYIKSNPTGWSYTNWQNAGEHSKNFESFKIYVIRCWNEDEEFYKIGRTFTSTKKRFKTKSEMPYKYEIVKEIISTAKEICELEWVLKNCNRVTKYIPKNKFKGMYECFKELNMSCFEDYNIVID